MKKLINLHKMQLLFIPNIWSNSDVVLSSSWKSGFLIAWKNSWNNVMAQQFTYLGEIAGDWYYLSEDSDDEVLNASTYHPVVATQI